MPPGKWRPRRVGIWLTPLAVVGCVIGLLATWPRLFPDPLTQSRRAYERKDWDAAARLARQTLRARPNDIEALRLLARSSVRLGHDDAAIAIHAQRLNENANQAEDFLLLGLALQRREQTAAAARAWDKVLEFDAIPPQMLDEFARLQMWYHRLDAAAAAAKRLATQPGWGARGRVILGLVLIGGDNAPGAAAVFREALRDNPNAPDSAPEPLSVRKLIARTFLLVDRPAEALPELKWVLARGADPEASWLLSRAYLRMGDRAQARQALAGAGSYRAENPMEAEPGPYVGAARCEKCHHAIYERSRDSRHTQSFYRGEELLGLPRPKRPWVDPDDPKVTHSLQERAGALWEETRGGDSLFTSLIEYAFGTSDRYLTMVSRDPQGQYHTVRMSYYRNAEGEGWDHSLLDTLHPDRPDKFQGETIEALDGVVRCLYCHATNPAPGRDRTGPEFADRGVGCERCHGPGGNHIAAVEAALPDLAIINPAAASPAVVTSRQCNECHILGKNFRRDDPEDPGWLRSKGVGWTWSRCNTESGGAFGCVTCHDPHQSARATSTAQYEAKCLACHSATTIPAQGEAGAGIRRVAAPRHAICPVNPAQGCIKCHMPRVRVTELHMDISDHYIRVHR